MYNTWGVTIHVDNLWKDLISVCLKFKQTEINTLKYYVIYVLDPYVAGFYNGHFFFESSGERRAHSESSRAAAAYHELKRLFKRSNATASVY